MGDNTLVYGKSETVYKTDQRRFGWVVLHENE